jgi:CHAD domain-containing protein
MCALRFVEAKHSQKHHGAHVRAAILKRISSDLKQTEKMAVKLRKKEKVNPVELHDFRIGLRRLQASAHILRQVHGSADVRPTLSMVKRLLKATGRLRAEQVLPQMLPNKFKKSESSGFIRERAGLVELLEARLPANFKKYLPDDFEESSRHLILDPLSEVANKKFRRRTDVMIKTDCKHLKSMILKLNKHKKDVEFQHKLRIRAKRLGYVLELLSPELRPYVRKVELLIKENQKVFGSLHDLDFAIKSVGKGSPSLKASDQRSLIRALKDKRPRMLKKALKKGYKLAKKL